MLCLRVERHFDGLDQLASSHHGHEKFFSSSISILRYTTNKWYPRYNFNCESILKFKAVMKRIIKLFLLFATSYRLLGKSLLGRRSGDMNGSTVRKRLSDIFSGRIHVNATCSTSNRSESGTYLDAPRYWGFQKNDDDDLRRAYWLIVTGIPIPISTCSILIMIVIIAAWDVAILHADSSGALKVIILDIKLHLTELNALKPSRLEIHLFRRYHQVFIRS